MPQDDGELSLTIKAWNLMSNGMGGIDYAGLPYVVAMLGFDDIETLLNRLLVIKAHNPRKDS